MWITTGKVSIIWSEPKSETSINYTIGSSSNFIGDVVFYDLVFDDDNTFWIASLNGLFKLSRFEGKIAQVERVTQYQLSDIHIVTLK